jgi:nicotinate-nucleotide pyrophosphorylase (carboxylating)
MMALSTKLNTELLNLGLKPNSVETFVSAAIAEDLAGGEDVTSVATISKDQVAVAEYHSRKAGVVAGLHIAAAVLEIRGLTEYQILVKEGDRVAAGEKIIEAKGNTRALLLTERTALNIVGRLSGIATLTRTWVDAISGTKAAIRDTRKTTPLLRDFEKFAVRMGGGVNHRMSLSDAALIKDNHVVSAGGVGLAFAAVKARYPNLPLEVEVDSLDQLAEVVSAGAELVLLDNMTPDQCGQAVSIVNGRAKLEASGGITLDLARAYAQSGVDYLAIGALTHSASVLDIGLDLRME